MGYSGKAIEDSLNGNDTKSNNIYNLYKAHIDKTIPTLNK